MNLGNVLSEMNRWDDARKTYERAVRLFELLVRDFPTVPDFAIGLAGAFGNLGRLRGDRDRDGLEKSLPMLDDAILILEPFHRSDERDVKVRDALYAAYHIRAVTLSGLDRHRDAQSDWDRAVELAPEYDLLNARSKRASNLLNLREFEKAFLDILFIAESPKANGEHLFIAASGYAIVAAETRDKTLAEERAARAVVLLREAMVKGHRCAPHQLDRFADLKPLYGREDFHRLMQDEESIYREGLKLKPDDHVRYYNLGHVVHGKGRVPEAIACFKKAIELRADYGEAHEMLGYVLDGLGDRVGAEAAYRESLKHYKDKESIYRALCNLAGVLGHQQRQPEAAVIFRQAIELLPLTPGAYFGLGLALGEQGLTREAIAVFREAIECDPEAPNAHANLGFGLLQVGEYAEAKKELKRCLDLIPANHPLRATMQRLLSNCDRFIKLEERLPEILEGTTKPADGAERVGFAEICLTQGRYATAVRLYAEAFRFEPELANGHLYNAARAATLAANGPQLPFGLLNRQRALWRRLAHDWLLDETDSWEPLVRTSQGRARVHKTIMLWQRTPDFASVRDKDQVANLPAAERLAWRTFWSNLDALLAEVKPKPKAELPNSK
jgi:tetratricopeptide (TPR) repeat protein